LIRAYKDKELFYLDGLVEYIKNNVPAYINVTYPAVMKTIDIKLKQFMETVVLQKGENVQFCKAQDVQGTPSSYGKIYYAECREDGNHLMTTIKKGQKAGTWLDTIVIVHSIRIFLFFIAAGILTVEVLPVEQEIIKIMEICLEELKNNGIYIPYIVIWNKLRNVYDIPRKRVGDVVQLVKANVFLSKKEILEKDDDIALL
jgi:hypothetical protein